MTPTDIITRLKAATGPDRWLDHMIAVALGIYPKERIKEINYDAKTVWFTDGAEVVLAPEYLSSIDAVLALVKAVLPDIAGINVDLLPRIPKHEELFSARFYICTTVDGKQGWEIDFVALAHTPQTALLIALFTALAEKEA